MAVLMTKHLLIDGDPLVYRSCLTREAVSPAKSLDYFASILDYILWDALPFPAVDDYTLFLSGKGNFRKDMYEDYKANRITPKPSSFGAVMELVTKLYEPEICNGYEADDGICMAAYERGLKNVIIVSSDKDFKQIPTEIYNTYNWTREIIPKHVATRNFWTQVLTGDSVDNIKGCRGIGFAKAKKLLSGCRKEEDYRNATLKAYMAASPETYLEDFNKAYTLVRLLRNKKEIPKHDA